jgi:hypothetical protein
MPIVPKFEGLRGIGMPIVMALQTARTLLMLAALLTVILLPWALLPLRRSLLLAGMTLAMLGMLWRGEAWKTVFLQ